jgi:hypothetical protein
MQSGRPPSVAQVLLCCSVGNDLRAGPTDALVRRGQLVERRNPEARIHVDGLRERFRPPRSVSFADAAGAVTSDEAFDLAIHLDVPRNGLEKVSPAMIRRNADNVQAIADPITETFRHFLPLRIRVLCATGAGGIVAQRKAYPSALFDKFQEPLADKVTMDRHLAGGCRSSFAPT